MTVKAIDLPTKIKGFCVCVCEPDGDYFTAVINPRLNQEQQIEAYMHEKAHVVNDDFYKEKGVQEIEYEAHKTA